MYLVDTNLIVEVLLRQAKAEEVRRFLITLRRINFFLTEFSLYSLGILIACRNLHGHLPGVLSRICSLLVAA